MSARPIRRPRSDQALRLGFVGLGWIGRKRLEAIASRDDSRIDALFDCDAEHLDAVAASYPDAATYDDLSRLLDRPLDGVVIATPNALHARQAIECLNRGIPVFCQKPLAVDANETRRIIDAARAADRLLAVDYSYRHVRGMTQLKERIRAGALGEIVAIDLEFHNAYAPSKQWCLDRDRSGGGCLLDLGVHLLDLALWLQDAPKMKVVRSTLFAQGCNLARIQNANSRDVEDLAYVELQQENGAIVRLACSWNAQIGCDALIGMQIHGTRGGASWRNIDGSFLDFDVWIHRGSARELLGCSRDDWGPGALSAWIDRLRHDRSFDPSALTTLQGARLIDEAYRR